MFTQQNVPVEMNNKFNGVKHVFSSLLYVLNGNFMIIILRLEYNTLFKAQITLTFFEQKILIC